MAFPNVVMMALVLALPDGDILRSTSSNSYADHADDLAQIQCTIVSLEYLSSGREKIAHSENCSKSTNSKQSRNLNDKENLSEAEMDED